MRRAILPSAILLALLLAPTPQAKAVPRRAGHRIHVAVLACITGSTGVAARRGCQTVPGAGHESSEFSGLDEVTALTASADRASLYAVGNGSSAVTQLALSPPATAISFGGCLTGDSFLDTCTHIPGAAANADEAPIANPTAAAISPDGRFLYLVSGNFHATVIASFARDLTTGTLTYLGCLTGDLAAGLGGPGMCSQLPTATRDGYGSGLNEPSGLAISHDGLHVYVTAALDQSVSAFSRDPASGALSFAGCVSSNRQAAGCTQVPGGHHVLEGLSGPVISPDGRYLYGAANRAETVDTFTLTSAGGIQFASCVTRREDRKPCRLGRPSGPVAALSNPGGMIVTADGRFVYVTSTYGTIVALKRNGATGALTPVSCISGNVEDRRRCTLVPHAREIAKASPLSGVRTPVLSGNGKLLFAPVRTADAILELRRNSQTGALSFRGCATGSLRHGTAAGGICQALPNATRNGEDSGFHKTTALAPGPGNLLYAASSADATVSLLRP